MEAGASCRTWWAVLCLFSCVLPNANAQNVTVSPNTLSFGNQAEGTASTVQKITLKNGQTTAVTIHSVASNLPEYSQVNNCPVSPATLNAGKSCTISVTFTPAALGTRAATLTVTDSSMSGPQTISLSGAGVAAVTISPSALSFGSQPLGLKSSASSITVTNNQSAALTIASIATNLSDYTRTTTCPTAPNTLAAKAHCSVSVFFDPGALGVRAATLAISDNANISPAVSLTGTGIIAAVASPTSLTFGSEALGATSAAQAVVRRPGWLETTGTSGTTLPTALCGVRPVVRVAALRFRAAIFAAPERRTSRCSPGCWAQP